MLTFYRRLLWLYPTSHRELFSEEMLAVFSELEMNHRTESISRRAIFYIRELLGVLRSALFEHISQTFDTEIDFTFASRRVFMKDGFRFPKTTAILMALILGGVLLAIKRGEDISASLPHVNPSVGPIQPAHSTLLPPIALFFAFFYAAGLIGWAILFALRRSGVHRLADTASSGK